MLAGWRLLRSTVPSAVRMKAPSICQPGALAGSEARSAGSARPSNRASVTTGTPRVASSARASSRRRTPCSPATSVATMACGRSPRILPTCWVSTRPGPASTNTRAPAAYMDSTWSTKRTPVVTCWARRSATAPGSSAGIGRCGHVRPDRERRAAASTEARPLGQQLARHADDGGVEGARHRQQLHLGARSLQGGCGGLHRSGRPGDHGLRRPVVVGQDDVGPLGEALGHLLAGQLDGRHGARVATRALDGFEDGVPPSGGEGEQRRLVERSRGSQRRQLAVAVTAGERRFDAHASGAAG